MLSRGCLVLIQFSINNVDHHCLPCLATWTCAAREYRSGQLLTTYVFIKVIGHFWYTEQSKWNKYLVLNSQEYIRHNCQSHLCPCDVTGEDKLVDLARRIFFLIMKKRSYLDTVHWAKPQPGDQDLKGRLPRTLRYLSVSKVCSPPLMSVEPSTAMPNHSRDHFR